MHFIYQLTHFYYAASFISTVKCNIIPTVFKSAITILYIWPRTCYHIYSIRFSFHKVIGMKQTKTFKVKTCYHPLTWLCNTIFFQSLKEKQKICCDYTASHYRCAIVNTFYLDSAHVLVQSATITLTNTCAHTTNTQISWKHNNVYKHNWMIQFFGKALHCVYKIM